MKIDLERLAADREYWDSVAPEGAMLLSVETGWKKWEESCEMEMSFKHKEWTKSSYPWSLKQYQDEDQIKTITRPEPTPAWDGQGLPPVGTVCEVNHCEEWKRCEILAHFKQRRAMVAAFTVDVGDGAKTLDAYVAEEFRPIRSEEDKAVQDVKQMAIRAFQEKYPDRNPPKAGIEITIRQMYRAGYRKGEPK